MKKKILATSLLAIVMCLSLIVGATLALFMSSSDVDIAVTSGKIDVTASINEQSVELYSPAKIDLDGTIADETNAASNGAFAGGGTATFDGGTLMLDKIAAGDRVSFTIDIANKSNVSAQYRVLMHNTRGG